MTDTKANYCYTKKKEANSLEVLPFSKYETFKANSFNSHS